MAYGDGVARVEAALDAGLSGREAFLAWAEKADLTDDQWMALLLLGVDHLASPLPKRGHRPTHQRQLPATPPDRWAALVEEFGFDAVANCLHGRPEMAAAVAKAASEFKAGRRRAFDAAVSTRVAGDVPGKPDAASAAAGDADVYALLMQEFGFDAVAARVASWVAALSLFEPPLIVPGSDGRNQK